MRKLFPVREKSGNFEQSGKVKKFYPKLLYLLNFLNKNTEKNTGKGKKILEKLGKFVSPKCGNHE